MVEPGEQPDGRDETIAARVPETKTFASGRYVVRRLLGEGAQKTAYLVHDQELDRDCALSLIRVDLLNPDDLARVRREAQMMAGLGAQPHIVTVFDLGEDDGKPYIVCEYVPGGDLRQELREARGPLPLHRAVALAKDLCRALSAAHEQGIVHRDLKPGNVWLTKQGAAKLGDFGIAQALDRSRLTMTGTVMGTAAYMAPEQALGRQADARSDLYSLGAMLYEMMTGRPPFLGDDAVAIISQHINTAPVAPYWHNPEVPRALDALILRLLAKAPEDRPESAAAVREALSGIATTASAVAEQVVQEQVNPLDRLAGGVFVGREREIDELRAGLEDSLSGRGRLLMLVGEPGIGKTRTSEELATYARLRDAQVLWGRCYEGEGAPAYWPWVQLIRSFVHDRDPAVLMSEMGPGAADIAQVVSEVKARLPGLPEPPALEPEQARFRLFDSATTFFKNAAQRQPLVLILDDLHWADKPSLLLLQFLARELEGSRLLVLGTYRDVELGRQHPLTQMLGDLSREQLSHRIVMRRLTERDVARFIEMTAGLEPLKALVAAVYNETEGNPFFVSEVVRLLASEGHLEHPEEVKSWSVTIPQGVREAVGRRLDHLSEECNQVLTTASVIGREFGRETLERASDVRGERLLEVLDEATSARIIVEVSGTVRQYRFSHALIREALYEELRVPRRVRLHGRIGEVLEDIYSGTTDRHLAELANHFFEAARGDGDIEKAIDYAERAGELAIRQIAYEEAVGHYAAALQAQENMLKSDDRRRGELLLSLGDAQWKAGDAPAAKQTYLQAVELARATEDPDQMARAALGVAGPWGESEVGDPMVVPLLMEALDTLMAKDGGLRARLMSSLAVALYWTSWSTSLEERDSLSRAAIDMARRASDKPAILYAMRARHIAFWHPDNLDERLAIATEGLVLAQEVGDVSMALTAHVGRVVDLLELGDIDGADREIEVYGELANEVRTPEDLWHAASLQAMRALFDGRFQEAEELAQNALAVGQKRKVADVVVGFGMQIMLLRWEQARLEELEPIAKNFVQQYPKVPGWRSLLSWLYSELGRKPEAQRELDHLAANDFVDIPKDWWWLTSLSLLAESCSLLGDQDRAARLYHYLLPYRERNVVVTGFVCFGPCSRFLGILAGTMGRWDEAAAHFEDAMEMSTRMGARSWLARTQHQYADMLLRRDEPGAGEKALQLLAQALDTAQELGMKALMEKALALKLRAQGIDPRAVKTSIGAVAAAAQSEQPDLRPHAAPDGTVTLIFTDIEDSTPLNKRLGDQRWMDLLRAHNALIREEIRSHDGYEVKTEGDGFMVAFGSARKALQCAIAVQRSSAKHNESAEEPVQVRIGLHIGEVVQEAGDFYGKHVNLASRIADEAKGGEILVSSLLRELTESGGDIAFGEGRQVELRGLGRQRVFEVAWE